MGEESPKPASTPTGAVFLSYASQDAEAAQRICTALRSAGVEVWFDQSELRGGDAWDLSIRKRIKTCALFLPVISRNTHDRVEGYFRLEWKLAVDRSHLIAADQAFLLPVVIDETRDDDERVPERFRDVQWTRLPGGGTPAAFVERVRRLLSGEPAHGPTVTPLAAARVPAAPSTQRPALAFWRSKAALLATIGVVVVALGYLAANRLLLLKRGAEVGAASGRAAQSAPAPTAFNPPLHSIAVLPFVNLSGDKEQDYFSDGLTEELLNALSRVDELQVAARTSSFYFKGKDVDLGTVAHKLNVSAVLEGSVRRDHGRVRITVQLINATTGFHLWSQTYDRDLRDILALQADIAEAVTRALAVRLLGGAAAKVELGSTRDPRALDAYLRGLQLLGTARSSANARTEVDAFTEALSLDPNFALAYAYRALALTEDSARYAPGPEKLDLLARARSDAERAIALAPGLGEAHAALAWVLYYGFLDPARAAKEYDSALALAPGNARVPEFYSMFAADMGHHDAALAEARRALTLDPLNPLAHRALGYVLKASGRYAEAAAAYHAAITLDSRHAAAYAHQGESYYLLGNLELARSACEVNPDYWESRACLAMVYHKLGRQADAQRELEKLGASHLEGLQYVYAEIYAQWGDTAKALDWLESALHARDPGLVEMRFDALLAPLRKEPRFQAIERELRFPS
jgi:TolB-like protein